MVMDENIPEYHCFSFFWVLAQLERPWMQSGKNPQEDVQGVVQAGQSDNIINIRSTSTATGTNAENKDTSIISNSITNQGKDTSFLLPISHSKSTSLTDNGTAASESLVVNNDSASREPQHTQSTPPMSNVQESTTIESVNGSLRDGAAGSLVNKDSGSATPPKSPEPASTTNDSGMDVDVPATLDSNPVTMESTVPTSTTNVSGMDVDTPASANLKTTAPKESYQGAVAVAAPRWLNALNMDIYLQECSDAKEWQELVKSYYKFGEGNAINGVCSSIELLFFLLIPS